MRKVKIKKSAAHWSHFERRMSVKTLLSYPAYTLELPFALSDEIQLIESHKTIATCISQPHLIGTMHNFTFTTSPVAVYRVSNTKIKFR